MTIKPSLTLLRMIIIITLAFVCSFCAAFVSRFPQPSTFSGSSYDCNYNCNCNCNCNRQKPQCCQALWLETAAAAGDCDCGAGGDGGDCGDPQVMASGYSSNDRLEEAIRQATELAMKALPPPSPATKDAVSHIDLAVIFVSSLYDGTSSPSIVVPTLLETASSYGYGIQHILGSTAGGIIGSVVTAATTTTTTTSSSSSSSSSSVGPPTCQPIELEGCLGVSVLLMMLPDVTLKTFHVVGDDVPDSTTNNVATDDDWKSAIGLKGFDGDNNKKNDKDAQNNGPVFMVLPLPVFQNKLDDLLHGLQKNFPHSKTFGGLASTVSSLSRARLFRYDQQDPRGMQTLGDGCVGIAMAGDIDVQTMVAQGTKPVGGIYKIIQSTKSTIKAIVLDETATELERKAREAEEGRDDDEKVEEEVEDDDDDDVHVNDKKAQMAKAYAKASIPKPILAEANFLMRNLSDDDQAFMRKALLVGLEKGGSVGRSPSILARLRAGQGHRFEVQQVASANMKDGSVTLPLGSVHIEPGTQMRFFVRDEAFAKKEVEALWMGYKRRLLNESFQANSDDENPHFQPTGCFLVTTLDRGSKFFNGRVGFESGAVTEYVPDIGSVSGFYSNGVIMKLDGDDATEACAGTYGSASGYVLLGSKSGRPKYSPTAAAKAKKKEEDDQREADEAARAVADQDARREKLATTMLSSEEKAPRSEDKELILKRRDVHSGRALSVSTVEWSVAEKTATASSTLEGFMWDKETEVDRFRERVPLANLVSQCRLSAADPTKPKPRDWVGVVKEAAKEGFVIIPECKRTEPFLGTLWKKYNVEKLAEKFTTLGAPALSVNCDAVLFGGSQEDITKVRNAAGAAALAKSTRDDGVVVPPILVSDLILYPYQLYKLSLAGADAVNLLGASLASKDLMYLTKIASSLKLQILVTVTSEVQLRALAVMSPGSIDGVIISNRELEDFSFDMTGQRALDLLNSDALTELRQTHGDDIAVFVEGRVGIIERPDSSGKNSARHYLAELRDAGAMGAIVGGGLAQGDGYNSLQMMASAM